MHLLDELSRKPDATQRELAKRVGVALGLTNLMLRRLVKKGYVKISGTKYRRIRYLITPQGILEKTRLTYEFIHYSLQLYDRVRRFLREQLAILTQIGYRRVLLYGPGELAEIAFLTIREMGVELVGVVDQTPDREQFLGHPVRRLSEMRDVEYDRLIVCALRSSDGGLHGLVSAGVPAERLIVLPMPGMPLAPSASAEAALALEVEAAASAAEPV